MPRVSTPTPQPPSKHDMPYTSTVFKPNIFEDKSPTPMPSCPDSSCLLHGWRWDNMFRPSQSACGPRRKRRHPRPTTANRISPPSFGLHANLGMGAVLDCRRWQRRLRPRERAHGVLPSQRMCGTSNRWRLLLMLQSTNLDVLILLLLELQGTFSLPSMYLQTPLLLPYHRANCFVTEPVAQCLQNRD